MNAFLWSTWNTVTRLGIPKPSAAELALLILLGASVLALRSLRENYLKVWVLGWLCFAASRLSEHSLSAKIPAPFDLVTVQALFVLAVGLLAGAVLVYTRTRDLLLPLMVITPILVGFAGARVLLWPDSLPLRMALELGYRLVLLTASIALLRARRGRWEPAAWLLAICLPTLHLSWPSFTDAIPAGAYLALEIALGISVLLVGLDHARVRAGRLEAMQKLTESISSAQQYGNVVQSAVEQLRRLMSARGVWFRLLESGSLVATHAAGLSSDFLRDAGIIPTNENTSKLLEKTAANISTGTKSSEPEEALGSEKIHQLVTVPVIGNKAPVGLLMLGTRNGRGWDSEELEFLQAYSKQLAVAVENFRLLEQVLRSQRQWMNTFDSVHDVILAHDADFRIIKANQVAAGATGQGCCGRDRQHLRVHALAHIRRLERMPILRDGGRGGVHRGRRPVLRRILGGLDFFLHRARQPAKRHDSRGPRHHRAPLARKKNTGCCSSRCRKVFMSRLRRESCSTATMHSYRCSVTAAAQELMVLNLDSEICVRSRSSARHSAARSKRTTTCAILK